MVRRRISWSASLILSTGASSVSNKRFNTRRGTVTGWYALSSSAKSSTAHCVFKSSASLVFSFAAIVATRRNASQAATSRVSVLVSSVGVVVMIYGQGAYEYNNPDHYSNRLTHADQQRRTQPVEKGKKRTGIATHMRWLYGWQGNAMWNVIELSALEPVRSALRQLCPQ